MSAQGMLLAGAVGFALFGAWAYGPGSRSSSQSAPVRETRQDALHASAPTEPAGPGAGPSTRAASGQDEPEERYPSFELTGSPFGLHVLGKDLSGPAELGAHWTRELVLWKRIEPRKGQFRDIDKAVRRINALTDAGFEVLPRIVSVNPWAESRRINNLNEEAARKKAPMGNWTYIGYPTDVGAYRAFVTRVVEAFDGDGKGDAPGLKKGIKYWQVENEWDWRWKDSPEKFVEFLKIAYETIKAADPEAQVVLGGLSKLAPDAFYAGLLGDRFEFRGKMFTPADMNKLEGFQQQYPLRKYVLEHGYPYFDIISFHQYGRFEAIEQEVEYLRSFMEKHGYRKPLWMTEAGGPFIAYGEKYSEELQAYEVVKYYVTAMANGVQVIFWSTYLPTPEWGAAFTNTALVEKGGRRKPAYEAYRIMGSKLGDAVKVERLMSTSGAHLVRFTLRSGKPVYVAWRDGDPGKATPALGRMQSLLDARLEGRTLEITRCDGTTQTVGGTWQELSRQLGAGPLFVEVR